MTSAGNALSAGKHLSADCNADTRQRDLLDALEESLDHKIDEFETVINQTDVLTTEEFMARVLPKMNCPSAALISPYKVSRG